jgi:hypothetical protein
MRTHSAVRVVPLGWLGLLAALTGGCTALLNQDFLAAAGFGQQAAGLPGEAPAIVIGVENRTDRVIEARLSWRDVEERVNESTYVVIERAKLANALVCSIPELTIGDVNDRERIGAAVRLGAGGANDPFIEVEAFGRILQEGIDYACGDEITFVVIYSTNTRSGFQIIAEIKHAGAQ